MKTLSTGCIGGTIIYIYVYVYVYDACTHAYVDKISRMIKPDKEQHEANHKPFSIQL